MASDPLFIIATIACLGVLVVLGLGIGSFGKDGQEAGRRSNKLMRYRIIGQFIAVGLIMLFVYLRRTWG